MKKTILNFGLSLLIGSTVLVGCQRQKDALFDQSAVDNATVDAQFNDLDNVTSDVMLENDNDLGLRGGVNERTTRFRNCGTVDINTVTKTITIDFGTGTTCTDGRTRRGKIVITYTGRYLQAGSIITTTPVDYYVNNVKVEGVKTVTNITEPGGNPKHSVRVREGKLTYSDGTTLTWITDRVREWQSGSNTPFVFSDDVWSIKGTASGVNRRGKAFASEITSPLIVKAACFTESGRFPVQGVYTVTGENTSKTVDFGTGNCDRNVTVTIANVGTFQVTIP